MQASSDALKIAAGLEDFPSLEGCRKSCTDALDESRGVSSSRRSLLACFQTAVVTAVASIGIFGNSYVAPCVAITAEEASSSYDRYASSYDRLDGGEAASALGIDAARTRLLRSARGDVLEVGVGTGLNIDRYRFGDGGVTSLTLVDISEGMLAEARAKVKMLDIPPNVRVEFVRADATSQLVPIFGTNAFDSVVDTFSLCVMGNQGAKDCLLQMAKVVKSEKDGGQILLIENTRSSSPFLGWYQDITAETAAKAGGKGCMYNQDVAAMIQNTPGLHTNKEEAFFAGLFRSYVIGKN